MAVLVKFARNWADEFDVYGFKLYDLKHDFVSDLKSFQEDDENGEYYFGTNEGWDRSEIHERNFSIQELSEEQYSVMLSLFPDKSYGIYPI